MSPESPRSDNDDSFSILEEVKTGDTIYPEVWRSFDKLFRQKITEIESQTITDQEKIFLDRVASLGSSYLQHFIRISYNSGQTNRATPYSSDPLMIQTISHIRNSILQIQKDSKRDARLAFFSPEDLASEPFVLMSVLYNRIGTPDYSVRQDLGLLEPMKAYALNITLLIRLVGEFNEGILVDDYIKEKTQELLIAYKNTEKR